MICLKHIMTEGEIGGYLLAWETGELEEDDLLVVLQAILDQRRFIYLIGDDCTLMRLANQYIQEGKLDYVPTEDPGRSPD